MYQGFQVFGAGLNSPGGAVCQLIKKTPPAVGPGVGGADPQQAAWLPAGVVEQDGLLLLGQPVPCRGLLYPEDGVGLVWLLAEPGGGLA